MKTGFEGAEIQICDDVIAIVVRIHNIPRIIIWQWTTGNLLLVSDVLDLRSMYHLTCDSLTGRIDLDRSPTC